MGKDSADAAAGKMFSGDVVAAILVANGCTSLTMKQYEMMSALDGNTTASAFHHDFRCVNAEAKDLKARVEAGDKFEPVKPGNGAGGPGRGAGNGGPSKKRGSADFETPPTTPKKPRAAPKAKASKANGGRTASSNGERSSTPSGYDGLRGGDSYFAEAFAQGNIKTEYEDDNDTV